MSADPAVERFERLYRDSADPWRYATSRYEREKYEATLAALPDGRRGSCLEVGCSIGVLSERLAARFARLVAIDFSPRALEHARARLGERRNVELIQAAFPEEAPAGAWDVVLCSEVLYYLEPPAFERAVGWLRVRLCGGASVLAVSWRGPGRDEPLGGDEVHDRLARELSGWHALDARRDGYRLDRFDGR